MPFKFMSEAKHMLKVFIRLGLEPGLRLDPYIGTG